MTEEQATDGAQKMGNFITEIIDADMASGAFGGRTQFRFPPEPNGYLHLGHAKSICLNFGLAAKYASPCALRFDDTNPTKEEQEYVESIMADVQWLGFHWGDYLRYASDYFGQIHEFALQLIRDGKAYVDDQSADEIRQTRGTLTEPGTESPYRNRTVEENLDLFGRMRAGEFPDGARVLRAKIEMSAGNLNMRDPVMYRILHAAHHRTGSAWCIYPMYDWAHGQSDSIEGVTHSICTLEFEDHRPLYDWYLDALGIAHPKQIEFARLNLTHTVLSKRKLIRLVREGHVDGWDDPRMPTISGVRRRGFPPSAIRRFAEMIGVGRKANLVEAQMLEHCVREELNRTAIRRMAVLNPVRVVIEDYPEGRTEMLTAENNPEDAGAGTRELPFSREIYIERDDFMEEPPRKFFRLAPGREVRLKHAYIVMCERVVKDEAGRIVEIRCTHDRQSKSGGANADRKVKGTLHWVSAAHAAEAEVRLYDHLFSPEDPDGITDENFAQMLNPDSLKVLSPCYVEPALAHAAPGEGVQFLRMGYFTPDSRDSAPGRPVFNRTLTLKDSWAKIQKKDA
jgi:glutaminyl-tRNA synthetase